MMGKRSFTARAKEWMMEYAYLVTLCAIIAVIAASAMYTQHIRRQTEAGVQAAAEAPEIAQSPEPSVPDVTPLPTIAPMGVAYTARPRNGGTVWPVSGAVIRPYDETTPVFWEALSCVQTHAAVDIAGQEGESVLCVSDGVVAGAAMDELWGWRITIAQTDGREAVYAGLTCADVTKGQTVTRGQTLGILMEKIPCEAELGPHLHLELRRDGALQDPEGMMPERREKPVADNEI